MKNFWIQFAVSSAVEAAEAALLSSGLSAPQKTALQNLVNAGGQVASAFGSTAA
jgi:hypothetical protein